MIGIGIDLVDIERFRRSLERTPSMTQRLFTATELAYVAPKVDPVPSLAARFAAREAVMKALGVGLGAFGFHDVWVERVGQSRGSFSDRGGCQRDGGSGNAVMLGTLDDLPRSRHVGVSTVVEIPPVQSGTAADRFEVPRPAAVAAHAGGLRDR